MTINDSVSLTHVHKRSWEILGFRMIWLRFARKQLALLPLHSNSSSSSRPLRTAQTPNSCLVPTPSLRCMA